MRLTNVCLLINLILHGHENKSLYHIYIYSFFQLNVEIINNKSLVFISLYLKMDSFYYINYVLK